MTKSFFAMALLLLIGACASSSPADRQGNNSSELAVLEQRLLDARWIHFSFDIEARGALSAHVMGHCWLGQEGEARLMFEGRFQGRPVHSEIVSDGILIRHSNPRISQKAAPLDTYRAFVLGLTRMGLLHNIAVSFSGRAPDRAMGDVDQWLEVSDLVVDENESQLSFNLSVGGKPSAQCRLSLDPEAEFLPTVRHQTVRFSESATMHVVEKYFNFGLSEVPPIDLFGQ